jgi:hypothetical protein
MQIDTFLTIGKTHKVCEDYILSGTDPIPYIILADGCSSSKGTDMGARLLCYLAQQYIRFRAGDVDFAPDHNEMGLWIIHNAELVAKQLGLQHNALDATLIVAYQQVPLNMVRVLMYGDGCVVYFDENGYKFGEVDYSQNAPYYLSYQISPERDKAFYEMKQKKIIRNSLCLDGWETTEDALAYDVPAVYNYTLDNGAGLMIASDGLVSFVENKVGIVNFKEYADQFFAFKTTAGSFLQRRANRVLKDLAKKNISNADDLSIGVFLMGD